MIIIKLVGWIVGSGRISCVCGFIFKSHFLAIVLLFVVHTTIMTRRENVEEPFFLVVIFSDSLFVVTPMHFPLPILQQQQRLLVFVFSKDTHAEKGVKQMELWCSFSEGEQILNKSCLIVIEISRTLSDKSRDRYPRPHPWKRPFNGKDLLVHCLTLLLTAIIMSSPSLTNHLCFVLQ